MLVYFESFTDGFIIYGFVSLYYHTWLIINSYLIVGPEKEVTFVMFRDISLTVLNKMSKGMTKIDSCSVLSFPAKKEFFPVSDATPFFTNFHHVLKVTAA